MTLKVLAVAKCVIFFVYELTERVLLSRDREQAEATRHVYEQPLATTKVHYGIVPLPKKDAC